MDINYEVRRSVKARRMRVTIHRDGRVVATMPRFLDLKILDKFVEEKKEWIIERVQKFLSSPLRFVKNSSKRDLKKYKAEVLVLVNERLEYYNKYYNLKYNRISIRNQKSRWGSCSKKGNLNFNYKILQLPPEIRDYIIVHELCHLQEFNHSKDFWNLVKVAIPNYVEVRNGLKLN
jgi:predicted metal-dependent hydrolase